jgi:hypothetical protein
MTNSDFPLQVKNQEEESRKKENAVNRGHFSLPATPAVHALLLDQSNTIYKVHPDSQLQGGMSMSSITAMKVSSGTASGYQVVSPILAPFFKQ